MEKFILLLDNYGKLIQEHSTIIAGHKEIIEKYGNILEISLKNMVPNTGKPDNIDAPKCDEVEKKYLKGDTEDDSSIIEQYRKMMKKMVDKRSKILSEPCVEDEKTYVFTDEDDDVEDDLVEKYKKEMERRDEKYKESIKYFKNMNKTNEETMLDMLEKFADNKSSDIQKIMAGKDIGLQIKIDQDPNKDMKNVVETVKKIHNNSEYYQKTYADIKKPSLSQESDNLMDTLMEKCYWENKVESIDN